MTPDTFILAGIISSRTNEREIGEATRENIKSLKQIGGHELLRDEDLRLVAEVAIKYHDQTGDFLDLDTLSVILQTKNLQPEKVTSLKFVFSAADVQDITQKKFRWWLSQVDEETRTLELADVLLKAGTILEGKVNDEDGVAYSGSRDAMAFLNSEVARISLSSNIVTQPSGNIREETDEVIREVERAERGEVEERFMKTGFAFIDDHATLKLTDFMLIGAYTGEGKSQACSCIAWNGLVDGKNGLVITAETARKEYRRRIVCRHMHKPGVGVIGGIPYNNIKFGRWESDAQREIFARALSDFGANKSYGVLDITQMSAGATVEDIRTKANSFQQQYGVQLHYIVADYLALMAASRKRSGRREEINDILREFKELCLTFNNGEGVIGIGAHQMKQEVRERVKPEPGKFYTVRDYADTSEAGKSIDIGVTLLRDTELEKLHEVAANMVKNRDGECPHEVFRLYEDYASSYLGNLAQTT